MRKLKTGIFLIFFSQLFLTGSSLFAQIKTDRFFPDSTQIYFAVSDVKELGESWRQTQLSQTISDPKFDAFRTTLQTQIEESWPNRLGLKLSDFADLPTGEISGGLIAPPGKRPGFAVMMNVSGNSAKVKEFLVRLIRQTNAAKLGEATQEKIAVGTQSVDATVLTFPPDENHPIARKAYYIALPQILLATDQKYLAELVLRKLAGDTKNLLVDRPEYQAILSRCEGDSATGKAAQIRFFANPLAAGEAIRSLTPPEAQQGRSPFDILAKQGFDGIKGVGGTIDFASENFEIVYRIKVYVPEPPVRALKMFAFNNVEKLTPPAWVGENAISYTTVNINALTAFNNVGPLFDEFLETEGAWNDILDSLEKDKRGPQVNLRADLFANFGRQFSSTNSFDPDRLDDGEKFVFSLNILEGKEAAVSEALHRMFDSDPDFKQIDLDGADFWQYAPRQNADKTASTATARRQPTRPTRPSARPTVATRPTADPGPESEIIEGGVFGVAQGCLFVSNDAQYLRAKLQETANGAGTSIVDSPWHRRAVAILDAETAKTNGLFIQGFGRNVDGLRANYELFRQGKTPQGKTLTSKIVNAIINAPDQAAANKTRTNGAPKIEIDGSTLPPFDEIVDTIGFNAFFGALESDGYFYKGFSVRPEN